MYGKFIFCVNTISYIYQFYFQISRHRSNYRKEGCGWDPINRFDPSTYLCLSETGSCISNVICRAMFYFQWVEVRGDCPFYWYWWKCWPSLFKHSNHNQCVNISTVLAVNTSITKGIQYDHLGNLPLFIRHYKWAGNR
jgi:hypothetical protein